MCFAIPLVSFTARYHRRMAQLYVEGWAPEYGSPYETDEALADEGKVDESVEVDGPWAPSTGLDDGVARIAFVDGVRRVDARLTIDEPDGPVPRHLRHVRGRWCGVGSNGVPFRAHARQDRAACRLRKREGRSDSRRRAAADLSQRSPCRIPTRVL